MYDYQSDWYSPVSSYQLWQLLEASSDSAEESLVGCGSDTRDPIFGSTSSTGLATDMTSLMEHTSYSSNLSYRTS